MEIERLHRGRMECETAQHFHFEHRSCYLSEHSTASQRYRKIIYPPTSQFARQMKYFRNEDYTTPSASTCGRRRVESRVPIDKLFHSTDWAHYYCCKENSRRRQTLLFRCVALCWRSAARWWGSSLEEWTIGREKITQPKQPIVVRIHSIYI